MTTDFRFEPKVAALLAQIELVRDVRAICREALGNELRKFVNHLRQVLPGLVPGMKEWRFKPDNDDGYYGFDAFADDRWQLSESDGITFGLYVKSPPARRARVRSMKILGCTSTSRWLGRTATKWSNNSRRDCRRVSRIGIRREIRTRRPLSGATCVWIALSVRRDSIRIVLFGKSHRVLQT